MINVKTIESLEGPNIVLPKSSNYVNMCNKDIGLIRSTFKPLFKKSLDDFFKTYIDNCCQFTCCVF